VDRKEKMKRRADLASGKMDVELVLTNCKIVNVFSHRIIEGNIAIDSGKIIGIGDYVGKKHIDMGGKYVAPGLIDSHEHLESCMVTPGQLARVVVPKGTTTIIADPHEIANVCGLDGINFMMEAAENVPLNVFFMLPSCVPATPFENAGAELTAKELSTLIDMKWVLGLGELMDYPGVIHGRKDIIDKMVIAEHKIIDGHGPAISGKALNAYVINGVKTDHECSNLEEMEERLGLGMYIAIREGSAARNLATLIHGVNRVNERRCTFCTDDKNPEDILKEGHIDYNIKLAIKNGIHPISAIQMATINTAECYNLRDIGAIAPGYDADLIVLDDLATFNIVEVFKKGKVVAADGLPLFEVERPDTSKVIKTVNMPDITVDDLKIPLKMDIANVIRVQPYSLVTEKVIRKVSLDKEGNFISNKYIDIVKMAVIERHNNLGNIGLGLVENFMLKNGAIATTIAHDSHNLIVIGDNDEDMVAAIQEVKRLDGGIAIAQNGKILESLGLPIAGLISMESMEDVSEKLKVMHKIAFEKLEVSEQVDPFMTLSFLALPVIPDIKLTDKGLFDVTKFDFMDVGIEE